MKITALIDPYSPTAQRECATASRYTSELLNGLVGDFNLELESLASVSTDAEQVHPAQRWAESGLMSLTGDMCPVPLASCADGALSALAQLSGSAELENLHGANLLSERALLHNYKQQDQQSLGGSCRILPTRDGHLAINLARSSDWEQLPAWLGLEQLSATKLTAMALSETAAWQRVAQAMQTHSTDHLIEQGRLLGLALADANSPLVEQDGWYKLTYQSQNKREHSAPINQAPTVLDLSSLWAGPLCGHLWQLAGAQVIKFESSNRPDGARGGSSEFFELLNQGKKSVCLDLSSKGGQACLREMISNVDIVIEGSRPRALRQMGIFAEQILDDNPGLSWISISGYGRDEPQANWIAYGDDAAVSAGLSNLMHQASGKWLLCGDAIADPLTGLHAALAGWASWQSGGGKLIDLSLQRTVQHCISASADSDKIEAYEARRQRWHSYIANREFDYLEPRTRQYAVSSLGSDNEKYVQN